MTSIFGNTGAGKSLVARSRHAALTVALLASALATAAPALADCNALVVEAGNGWVNPYTGTARVFEVDFNGDVTNVIPPQITADPMTNAFAGLDLWDNQTQVNPTTVTYDQSANLTRVVFSSQGVLPNPVPANWGSYAPDYNGSYHFGENLGWACDGATSLVPAAEYWIYPDGTTQDVPFLEGSWAGSFPKKATKPLWAAVYVEAADHSTGGWQLIGYAPPKNGKPVKIKLTNGSKAPIKIGLAGYELGLSPPRDAECLKSPQCAANQTALEQLNEVAMPVPGQPGSPFIALKVSKKAIMPGRSIVLTLK